MSSGRPETHELAVNKDVTIQSESCIKALGVLIDSELNFKEHIRRCCQKAARQLNALARISRYINIKSKSILYSSFVASNFKYCPLVWHFCGVTNNQKLEKLQERALRIIHKEYSSTYEELLLSTASQPLLLSRLKIILLEVFKSINKLNAPCLHGMFREIRTL